jgi:hypothetical protein
MMTKMRSSLSKASRNGDSAISSRLRLASVLAISYFGVTASLSFDDTEEVEGEHDNPDPRRADRADDSPNADINNAKPDGFGATDMASNVITKRSRCDVERESCKLGTQSF